MLEVGKGRVVEEHLPVSGTKITRGGWAVGKVVRVWRYAPRIVRPMNSGGRHLCCGAIMVEAVTVEDEALHGLACTCIVATVPLHRLQ